MIGIAIALSQFDKLNKLATGILASSAVLGLVLGLAARQVLANPLAGILLAISQPIRIGDTVTIADETGRVDDLTLSYTFIDTGDGRLVIVPNEQVVTSVVVNRSTGDLHRARRWPPSGCRPAADLSARARGAGAARAVADRGRRDHARTASGSRSTARGVGGTRPGEEGGLRERAQRRCAEAAPQRALRECGADLTGHRSLPFSDS